MLQELADCNMFPSSNRLIQHLRMLHVLVSRQRNGVQGFSVLFSSSESEQIRSLEQPDRVFTRPWASCHSEYPPLCVYRAICDGSLVCVCVFFYYFFCNSRSMVSVQSCRSLSLTRFSFDWGSHCAQGKRFTSNFSKTKWLPF